MNFDAIPSSSPVDAGLTSFHNSPLLLLLYVLMEFTHPFLVPRLLSFYMASQHVSLC